MKSSELLPGSKVDIRIVQLMTKKESSDIGVYIANIFDIAENGNIIINMPTQGGRIIVLPTDIRYEFVFTTKTGLYKAEGTVVRRFKQDNFYLLELELNTSLEKFQRREYYRLDCMMPLDYVAFSDRDEALKFLNNNGDFAEIDPECRTFQGQGTILDISGGGIRFTTKDVLAGLGFIALKFHLAGANGPKEIDVVARVVRSIYDEEANSYQYCNEFIIENPREHRLKDVIIKYIFDEERRIRKKDQGL